MWMGEEVTRGEGVSTGRGWSGGGRPPEEGSKAKEDEMEEGEFREL